MSTLIHQKRGRLLTLLFSFKYLFGDTLVMWNTIMEDLELKYNAKPVCLKPYPNTSKLTRDQTCK